MAILIPRVNPVPVLPINLAAQKAAMSVPVAVEVDTPDAVPPAILRQGIQVIPPVVNDTKTNDFISNLIPINRTLVPRVVSQSVIANTRVAVGTNVDLVLVGVTDIQIGILDGTRPDIAAATVNQVLAVTQDPTVAPILQQTTDPTTLTDAQKATITSVFTKQFPNSPVNEANPTQNFATTYATLQSVLAFQ